MKTTITIVIDQDVAVELHEIKKNRQLSGLINDFLREYTGLSKSTDNKKLPEKDLDVKISRLLSQAEQLKFEKDRRKKELDDQYKNVRFLN